MGRRSDLPPDHLVAELVGLLDDVGEIDDPADLELIAGTLLVPIMLPEVPEVARRVVVDAIEARGDRIAAGTLAALALLAPAPLAGYADEAAVRLGNLGLADPSNVQLGTLEAKAATIGVDEGAEIIVAVLGRPNNRARQVIVLGIDAGTDSLVECMLSPAMPRREADQMLRDPTNDPDAPPMQRFPVADLHARVSLATERARDLGIALGSDAAPALPIVARALTGEPDGIAWPEILAPWEEDDDELLVDVGEPPLGLESGEVPAARRPRGDTSSRRAKRKAQRSARKRSRGR